MSLAMLVYSLPDASDAVDSFLAFPGLGETWRVQDAIRRFEANGLSRFLLIAGHNQTEKTFQEFSLQGLTQEPYNLTRTKGLIVTARASNTLEQSLWVCEEIRKNGITSIMLCVSPYHCLRAYLTLLKTAMKHGIKIPILPMPTRIAPQTLCPEYQIALSEMIPGEIDRIVAYQQKGDVATYEDLLEYLDWLWSQPLIASY